MIFRLTVLCILFSIVVKALPQYEHPAVLENAYHEALYPDYLRSPHYQVPRLRAVLSRFSWFGDGEEPILTERATDKMSRNDIYTMLSHAGLIPRRQFF